MQEVMMYKCDYCEDLFETKYKCEKHEENHRLIIKAENMLNNGCTLKEINDECHLWTSNDFPTFMYNVTKDTTFNLLDLGIIKRNFKIVGLHLDKRLSFWPLDKGTFNKDNWGDMLECRFFYPNFILKENSY